MTAAKPRADSQLVNRQPGEHPQIGREADFRCSAEAIKSVSRSRHCLSKIAFFSLRSFIFVSQSATDIPSLHCVQPILGFGQLLKVPRDEVENTVYFAKAISKSKGT